MKVPTFYSFYTAEKEGEVQVRAHVFLMSIIGVIFGGIHCVGWFFIFPSSDEAMLWRVSSVVLTGIAFLFPLHIYIVRKTNNFIIGQSVIIILLVYVVSRLLLLVEALISLRHLTPGMLASVKWTSFIPHI